MKLKYERFEGLGCLSIRGTLDASRFRLLTIGIETLVNDLEETLLVNLSNVAISDAATVQGLSELKKKIAAHSKQKIYWICKERGVGDFPTTDLFIQRLSGFKFRQIGERIKLDDQLYATAEEVRLTETKIQELGGDEQNARKVILENKVLREQVRILQECVHWHEARLKQQAHVAATDPDNDEKIRLAKEALREPSVQLYGSELDL